MTKSKTILVRYICPNEDGVEYITISNSAIPGIRIYMRNPVVRFVNYVSWACQRLDRSKFIYFLNGKRSTYEKIKIALSQFDGE